MWLYGVLFTDKHTGTGKFGLFHGATGRDHAISLVKANGSGQVKRVQYNREESSFDAPTFNTISDPVFILADNAVTKQTAKVGCLVQVMCLQYDFPTPQYGIITGYSKRGHGTITVQPVRATENAWVNVGDKTVTMPMAWCKDCAGLNAWEVFSR